MESSTTTMATLLLRNLLTSIFIISYKSIIFVDKFKLFQTLRFLLVSTFLSFLQILPSLNSRDDCRNHLLTPQKVTDSKYGSLDSCIARALSQMLSIMNEIPLNSRKYDIVKSLAEKLIAENLEEGEALRMVNTKVLSIAFSRTLCQLEVAAMDQESDIDRDIDSGIVTKPASIKRIAQVYRTVKYLGDVAWNQLGKSKGELTRFRSSAEKLSAELHWLAEKLAASGSAEVAVSQWASASNLAWVALSTTPKLQSSLVRVSAFLLKQAKEMGGEKEEQRKTKLNMLISWLPFLCRAKGGVDTPLLSLEEKSELETVLDEIIQSLRQEEEQEKVLSLWLHHFTRCPSSDWPNLISCYQRWCRSSRKLFVNQQEYQPIEDIGL